MEEIGFEKDVRENRIIGKETKTTKLVALSVLIFIIVLGILSFYISNSKTTSTVNNVIKITKSTKDISTYDKSENEEKLEKIFTILNVFIIMLMIGILAVKKTIYYSSKLIKENDSLEQVLKQWRKIDLSLLTVSFIIPIIGLIITVLGMEFKRTAHFFIASFLLVFMLMPMTIKIRSRLNILKKYFTNIL